MSDNELVPCPAWAEKLADFHSHNLSPSDQLALKVHLMSCQVCTAVLLEYQMMDEQIHKALDVQPPLIFTAEQLQIRANMEELEREDELVQKLAEEICLYQDEIKQRIFSKVGNMDDAEDLAQETLLRFLKSLKGRTEIRSPKAYLFKIADNLVNDYFNGGKKTRLGTNNSIDIDAYLLMKEAMLALDRMTQRVIVYRVFQGLSSEEISRITGFSHRKIDDIINRSVNKIKEYIFEEVKTKGAKNG